MSKTVYNIQQTNLLQLSSHANTTKPLQHHNNIHQFTKPKRPKAKLIAAPYRITKRVKHPHVL